ncbi:quinate-4 [Chaetomidium leptoderma]|uniref:Quinate-4 n=1 Tax=Chaetomidium leptoderma TaxID=669021 RepID=A0AAN6ZRX9_9PEZI|nr:quinate-4 [Chaetomidium leptoderma]
MPCKLAIPTMSLGHCSAGHSLESKLDAAKAYGYQGVELSYEDLLSVACKSPDGTVTVQHQVQAARSVRDLCRTKGVEIISLQPFMQYEGILDRSQHESRFNDLLVWIKLARTLGTDLIMVPASSLPDDELAEGLDLIVEDLQRAADAGRQEYPHVRIAFEPRCSSTRINRWEYGWDVLERVCRPNFGLCIDTFHLAGLLYADPAVASGLVPHGERAVTLSLQRFVQRLQAHRDRIFLVQMGDGRRPDEPVAPGGPDYDPGQTPRSVWSLKYRLFYGEEARGGYLPITACSEAVFNGVGYEGWVSLELFSWRMSSIDPDVPTELARRGAISWRKLALDMGWWPTLPTIKTSAVS